MLAVPLLKDHGSHLRGVLGQGRNIPAKCQDDDNDEGGEKKIIYAIGSFVFMIDSTVVIDLKLCIRS